MQVKINDVDMQIDADSTVEDAIKLSNAPYIEGCAIALIEGRSELESHVNKYKIKTTSGSVIIELVDKADSLVNFWKDNYKKFKGTVVRWTTSQEAAMGQITSDLKPTHNEYSYNRWDVIVSLSGFSNESTHLILSKSKHSAVYGVPDENKGILATIVGGKSNVMNLKNTDEVVDIEPVIERKSIVNTAAVTDLNTKLKEGNELYTYLEVEANTESPASFEHFLKIVGDSILPVDYESETFISSDELKGLDRESEVIDKRDRGVVTVRTDGSSAGRVYLYRESRVSSDSHNIVGRITHGIQILDTVNEHDRITIRTNPKKVSTVAMTQLEADKYLEDLGIEHERDGLIDDDAVIVAQDPLYTVEINKENYVKTLGVPREDFVEIELYPDLAPRSVWYFRKIAGLLDGDVGHLRIEMAIKEMDLLMIKAHARQARGLIPENIPDEKVEAWDICLSNTACKHVGNIGIRFVDNTQFGPTGESFTSTNIIGKVVSGFDNLKAFEEGDTLYVKER